MIQAVTVCLDYGDFLAETLPLLAKRVDRVVVVTAERDEQTREVVSRVPNAECVLTDVFCRGGAIFRKGAAINEGLERLDRKGWLLHVDADIAVLDDLFGIVNGLARNAIYGCERRSLRGRELWNHLIRGQSLPQHAAPIIKPKARNITPLGFFQLWHSLCWREYPENSIDASKDDMAFAKQWSRRMLIPGYGVYHLESSNHAARANWRGRVTQQF